MDNSRLVKLEDHKGDRKRKTMQSETTTGTRIFNSDNVKASETIAIHQSIHSSSSSSHMPAVPSFFLDATAVTSFSRSFGTAATSAAAAASHTTIRSWGCGLTDTPFVFVHIGKAGGGTIRRRIAAAAVNVTRSDWSSNNEDQSYYPILRRRKRYSPFAKDVVVAEEKATFCNIGRIPRHLPPITQHVSTCRAMTPVGQALACPEYLTKTISGPSCGQEAFNHESILANIVQVGHYDFGQEVHWLPAPYLEEWWRQKWLGNFRDSNIRQDERDHSEPDPAYFILTQWRRLNGISPWCGNYTRPKFKHPNSNLVYTTWSARKRQQDMQTCAQEQALTERMDQATLQALDNQHKLDLSKPVARGQAMSALYASLPVLRVVLMRNPFSWLASRFSWHALAGRGAVCDNVALATAGAGHYDIYHQVELFQQQQQQQQKQKTIQHQPPPLNTSNTSDPTSTTKTTTVRQTMTTTTTTTSTRVATTAVEIENTGAPGWATRFALNHIYQLCGSDCRVRHYHQQATLTELVAQAEANLRHGFAVVGILLEEQEEQEHQKGQGLDAFLAMIAWRVDYMKRISTSTMSASNKTEKTAQGHSTKGKDSACKQKLQDPEFQQALIQASPEVAGLVHLFQVAVQVNQFQYQELTPCGAGAA
ncbi:hypothetical protein ACA910_004751 [Epithemia clementina (nom. ined.)]